MTWLVITTAMPNWDYSQQGICDTYSVTWPYLICEALQRAQELSKVRLSGRELTSPSEVGTVECSARVNDKQAESECNSQVTVN